MDSEEVDQLCSLSTSKHLPLSSSLSALWYKSGRQIRKTPLSNICQLLTPLLCVAFTVAVRYIAEAWTVGKINVSTFPLPLNLPIVLHNVPGLGIGCAQIYYYENRARNKHVGLFFKQTLKMYCRESQGYSPLFFQFEDVDKELMHVLISADKMPFERGSTGLKMSLPDGKIIIREVDRQKLSATIGINDWRLPGYHNNNGVTKVSNGNTTATYLRITEGMMSLMEQVYRSYLQLQHPREIIMGSFMYMPFDGEDRALINRVINIVGAGLYPLALSLLIPVLLYALVLEKEEKLLLIMRMNGLSLLSYWLHFLMHSLALSLGTAAILYCTGRWLFAVPYFRDTEWQVLWSVFASWSVALTSLTAFAQMFVQSAKTATIVGYLISVFSTLAGSTISSVIFPQPMLMPYALLAYPPFALCRVLSLIGVACAGQLECYRVWHQLPDEFVDCLCLMLAWIFVFGAVVLLESGFYSEQSNVVSKFVSNFYRQLRLRFSAKRTQFLEFVDEREQFVGGQNYEQSSSGTKGDETEHSVCAEPPNGNGKQQEVNETHPLQVFCLAKRYESQSEEQASLKPTSFHVLTNEIFGLLGPNGAGKTTLISVLTGVCQQSYGNAFIAGFPLGSPQINKYIGVCPQFDLLWSQLTVEEHLHFYAILKHSISSSLLQSAVNQSLQDVSLTEWRHFPTRDLSGGMRRRLSLAIALISRPKIVFLDQPSSGLDPTHRRQMWQILQSTFGSIQECKSKTSIVITTHLMEEAEVLCDRVAVIVAGKLQCVGTLDSLKCTFGQGFRVTITYKRRQSSRTTEQLDQKQRANLDLDPKRPKQVEELLRVHPCSIMAELEEQIILRVSKESLIPSLRLLCCSKALTWWVSPPSLYDVFLHFVT